MASKTRDAKTDFTEIANRYLGIETLETRNSDRLDFHDVAVWSIKEALEAAYRAGLEARPGDRLPDGRLRSPFADDEA